MKYMVISDIHGGISNLNKVLDIYKAENCNKLLILGDLFDYLFDINREDIINRLNLMSNSIIAVRGNCDYNINGLLFEMPIYNEIILNDKKIFLTHGHSFDKQYLLNTDSDFILTGHTHVPIIDEIENKIFINPGSITKSRMGDNSFSIITENIISIRNLNNEIIMELKI